MNREDLLSSIPGTAALHAMADDEIRRRTENLIDAILLEIEREGHEPDAWEADFLYSALGAIYHRRYWLALTCAEKSLVSPEDRSPAAQHRLDEPVTVQQVRDALAFTRGLTR